MNERLASPAVSQIVDDVYVLVSMESQVLGHDEDVLDGRNLETVILAGASAET